MNDSNQILHSDKDHQMPFVGGPDTRITNPRWRTAAILKNLKIAIPQPQLDRFWPNMARWCNSTLLTALTVKNLKFSKSKMAAAAILKNRKISIYRPRFNRFWQKLAWWSIPNIRNFKNPRWRRPPFLQNLAQWPFRSLKCKILKIQACGCKHLGKSKIEISWQRFDQSPRNLAWWRNSTHSHFYF